MRLRVRTWKVSIVNIDIWMVMMWPEVRPAGSFVEGRPETHRTGFLSGSVTSLVSLESLHHNGMASFWHYRAKTWPHFLCLFYFVLFWPCFWKAFMHAVWFYEWDKCVFGVLIYRLGVKIFGCTLNTNVPACITEWTLYACMEPWSRVGPGVGFCGWT